ncbi:beta-1,6-N-acetylglucosaminyltransferase [Brachyspira intermedia]|uniref:beta-1,6-N-acetylglucosaminyltransferase n=1 Tax=Brachyspira intermedia TaxID=84377 RepID=UPI003005E8D6
MSKICFLILAHKNQDQLMRLINHLKKDFDIYVHIDKKSNLNIKSFDNVKIYNDFKVYYADVTQVTTTLFLIEEAYKNYYDRYIFISGNDIPLKNNQYIKKLFYNNTFEYISYKRVLDSKDQEFLYSVDWRLNGYHFLPKIVRKLTNKKLLNIILRRKKFDMDIYYGSQWWNLTNNAVKYILNYVKENPFYIKRFKYTFGCDEFFFQSILLNSNLKNNCINDNLRYIDWNRMIGSHPHTFLFDDYNLIKSNIKDNLFARKFDENIDNDIIDKLYEDLENSN